jgi:hypothetical protein
VTRLHVGYDLVRVTLHGITHDAMMFQNSSVTTACGVGAGLGEIHRLGVLATSPPDVDCMSCLVAEGRPRAR